MTRSDLIAGLAANSPHLQLADVELIVATIFGEITAALARGTAARFTARPPGHSCGAAALVPDVSTRFRPLVRFQQCAVSGHRHRRQSGQRGSVASASAANQ
jgi:hypothetical protein